jgi:predicted dehydrogenase
MAQRLRVAVVGVGHLGQHHARLYAARRDVDLLGVVDADPGRAAQVAARHGTRALPDLRALPGEVDAVSVAVPTRDHHAVALELLRAGVHVLVEKPIAVTLEEADDLIDAARSAGCVLHVGHTERFNPALTAARPIVRRPRFLECQRLGTFAPRSLDVDVVLDLMIHDLDVVLSLVASEVVAIDAVGVNALTDKIDIANARIRFADGAAANLTASRISMGKTRKLRIFQPESYLSVDYAVRQVQYFFLKRDGPAAPEIVGRDLAVEEGEPLALEIDAFVTAAAGGADRGASGAEGRRALDAARRVIGAIEAGREAG